MVASGADMCCSNASWASLDSCKPPPFLREAALLVSGHQPCHRLALEIGVLSRSTAGCKEQGGTDIENKVLEAKDEIRERAAPTARSCKSDIDFWKGAILHALAGDSYC